MLNFNTVFGRTFAISIYYTLGSGFGSGTETLMALVPLRQKITIPKVLVPQHWTKIEFNEFNYSNVIVEKIFLNLLYINLLNIL